MALTSMSRQVWKDNGPSTVAVDCKRSKYCIVNIYKDGKSKNKADIFNLKFTFKLEVDFFCLS